MKVHIVVAEYSGVVNDVFVFLDQKKAEAKETALLHQDNFNELDDTITSWQGEITLPKGKMRQFTLRKLADGDEQFDVSGTDIKQAALEALAHLGWSLWDK